MKWLLNLRFLIRHIYFLISVEVFCPYTDRLQFICRYCLYPQDIVIQLENRSRLRKIQILSHQYLIGKENFFSFFFCESFMVWLASLSRFMSSESRILHSQFHSITATKIEFFVGDIPDEQSQDIENARYTRLG